MTAFCILLFETAPTSITLAPEFSGGKIVATLICMAFGPLPWPQTYLTTEPTRLDDCDNRRFTSPTATCQMRTLRFTSTGLPEAYQVRGDANYDWCSRKVADTSSGAELLADDFTIHHVEVRSCHRSSSVQDLEIAYRGGRFTRAEPTSGPLHYELRTRLQIVGAAPDQCSQRPGDVLAELQTDASSSVVSRYFTSGSQHHCIRRLTAAVWRPPGTHRRNPSAERESGVAFTPPISQKLGHFSRLIQGPGFNPSECVIGRAECSRKLRPRTVWRCCHLHCASHDNHVLPSMTIAEAQVKQFRFAYIVPVTVRLRVARPEKVNLGGSRNVTWVGVRFRVPRRYRARHCK